MKESPLLYFYVKENNRNYFCDAILSNEAITKYVLSRYEVDEIIAFGNWPAFDKNDSNEIELRSGLNYFTSDLDGLSAYSLFKYRIAQFIDDLKIEQQDLADLIGEDHRAEVIRYVNRFCRNSQDEKRISRLFEDLTMDRALYARFREGLEEIADENTPYDKLLSWTKGYLYRKLKDTCKLDILRENEDVKVSFVSARLPDDGILPVDGMLQTLNNILDEADRDDINILVALDNNDVTGNFVLMNLLDIADMMFGKKVEITGIFDSVEEVNVIAEQIRNDTVEYGITELTAAMRAFLRYGKADMLLDYWDRNRYRNETIEKMIYSMRKIDTGLSLCSIREMEDGINSLRKLFGQEKTSKLPDDFIGKMIRIFSDGIRQDYGKLMEGDEIDFIEMVKWGYRKNFLQQTLTLIESRATREFIRRGMFYYCNDEEDKQRCIEILARDRMQLKPYEYWKMDDIDHYFIKLYIRKEKKGTEDPQLVYARTRVGFLDNEDPEKLNAYTACDDRGLVTKLLYAYYHVGDIRNYINHADERFGSETSLMPDDKDESRRSVLIVEAIEFFIYSYEAVLANIGDKELDVVRIESGEVKAAMRMLEDEMKRDKKMISEGTEK